MTKILEDIRYHFYWLIDFLKGSPIRHYLNEITYILEDFNSEKSKKIRQLHLKNILLHAIKSTEFYGKLDQESSLDKFPIVDKNVFRDEKKSFLSRKKYKNTYSTITTGSTGTPLEVFQNKSKRDRNTADVIYFAGKTNFRIGFKLLYLRKWSVDLEKSIIKSFAQNIEPQEVMDLKKEYIVNLVDKLKKDDSRKGWIGYASGFQVICKNLEAMNFKPIHAKIRSIIANSEALNQYTKNSMSYYFNAPVYSRYSNMENGIIGQQVDGSGEDFMVNHASYHIEVLKMESDIPTSSGELGRIIVTDLFNYCMPIIRYNTGDLGVMDYSVSPPILKRIEGRKTDIIYNTAGDVVPSMIIASIDRYQGILQGQLIQESEKDYTLKLNITSKFKDEVKIIEEFKGYLGYNASIKIIYVDGIPLLNSGKRRSTVNNYRN